MIVQRGPWESPRPALVVEARCSCGGPWWIASSEQELERQGIGDAWALVLAALEYDHAEHARRVGAPVGARAQQGLDAGFY